MKNKQVILLLSGGIDSTTLLAKLKKEDYEVVAISFSYGQKHEIELAYAKKNAEKYNVKDHRIIKIENSLFNSSALVNPEIQISRYKNETIPEGKVNTYVPFRNLLFTSTALSLAETLDIKEIYLAFNQDDSRNFWDCTPYFLDKINSICSIDSEITIKAPFIELTKIEVIELAKELHVNLENTISCYQPSDGSECGECLSCVTKRKVLITG